MTWPSTLTTTPEHGKKSNKEKKPQDFLHLLDAIELVHGGYKFYLGVFQSRFFKAISIYRISLSTFCINVLVYV